MAGGFGRYFAEWMMQTSVGIGAGLWWSVMTFMVLPFQLVKKAIKPEKPKEYSSILITGASSGIGAELARGYAKSGVKLVLTARRAEKLAAVKKQCEDKGAEVKTLSLDVNNKDEMNKQITETDKIWPFDLVIANAGVEESTFIKWGKDKGKDADETALELDTQHGVTSTNCLGVVNTLGPLINRMKKDRKGQLVIMASLASTGPMGEAAWAAYSASKVWARAYGLAMRNILMPYGVGVTVICPGFIQSEMVDDIKEHGGAGYKEFVEMTVIPVETMVARSIEAIAHNVPVFFVPLSVLSVAGIAMGFNVMPPTLRAMMADKEPVQ